MTTPAETASTQPAIEVAAIVDPPSWHVPVAALQEADAKHHVRLTALESGFARLESKTDIQTVMLGEIKGAVFGGIRTVAENPWVRRLSIAIALGLAGALVTWLGRHGIKVEFSP